MSLQASGTITSLAVLSAVTSAGFSSAVPPPASTASARIFHSGAHCPAPSSTRKEYPWLKPADDGQTEGLTRDDLLDNITLYWLLATAFSSARIYWENNKYTFFAPKNVAIPVAVTAFPDEVIQTPRSWTERAYPNLIYYNKVDRGGHFAAWEQPQLLSEEVRAAFRSFR